MRCALILNTLGTSLDGADLETKERGDPDNLFSCWHCRSEGPSWGGHAEAACDTWARFSFSVTLSLTFLPPRLQRTLHCLPSQRACAGQKQGSRTPSSKPSRKKPALYVQMLTEITGHLSRNFLPRRGVASLVTEWLPALSAAGSQNAGQTDRHTVSA